MRSPKCRWIGLSLLALVAGTSALGGLKAEERVLLIGGKKFTESYVLGEIMAQLLEDKGFGVERQLGLGGTMIAFTALEKGEIDVYAEYTGTISQAILKRPDLTEFERLNEALKPQRLEMLPPLGFNNTYALAVRKSLAVIRGWEQISDLKRVRLKVASSYEFVNREDGYPAMKAGYGLDFQIQAMEHALAFEAIRLGRVDGLIVYGTDAKIRTLDLAVLRDDLGVFPKYLAVPLIRSDLPERAKATLRQLHDRLTEEEILEMNAQVETQGYTPEQVAQSFLAREGLVKGRPKAPERFDPRVFARRVAQHLYLSGMGVVSAAMVAIPLAVALLYLPSLAGPLLAAAGILQTVPSIALLAFMIPFFGIGVKAAIMALFLYAILPILRNTHVALTDVDPELVEVARGIGLSSWETLFFVRLPLSWPVILAGVRTAAVISVGTATLAAFIGAGGLGEPIVTGLALNDAGLLLQGAVPAAVLAGLADLFFSLVERSLQARR